LNTLLIKHKPSDVSKEEFEKTWTNCGYSLRALYKAILELKQNSQNIKREDFDCPNHYAKLAYEGGLCNAYDKIVALLPNTAKN
jgi:hypothetical protein